MPTFDFRFQVEASLRAVRDFHHDTRALKRLTPPPTVVQLHQVEPLGEGSVSRFTLWVGPLPLRWTAVHRDVSATGFTDVQAEGPARRWEHTHTFHAVADQVTEIHEHIEFEHKSGFWGVVTRLLFAYPNLYLMFTWRKLVTRFCLWRGGQAVAASPEGNPAPSRSASAPTPAVKP
ncbi:MAG: SRPBCC family protein [Planctomycetaceae bacterium]